MGTAGRSVIQGVEVEDIILELDRLHAYEMTAMHWALAMGDRLEGMAFLLLGDELAKRAAIGLENAQRLAARISQLGGAATSDPTRFVELSPVESFALPASRGDVQVILSAALTYERLFVQAYDRLCTLVRDADQATYYEALHLLKAHVKLEDDLETSLAGGR